jgi:methylmalonyl-CoA/ethylmalonyl-CoA epimerase
MTDGNLPDPDSAEKPPVKQVALRLHHAGFVVPRIADAVHSFIDILQLQWDGKVFHDPVQTVRVTFLAHAAAGSPMIELVEPAAPESRVNAFLKRGGGLHHFCYEVESLSAALDSAVANGALLIAAPTPAVAFGKREIAWVYTPDRLLVEFLQR